MKLQVATIFILTFCLVDFVSTGDDDDDDDVGRSVSIRQTIDVGEQQLMNPLHVEHGLQKSSKKVWLLKDQT